MSDLDETPTPIIPPAVVATVPAPPAAFVRCDRCGVERETATPAEGCTATPAHSIGPLCRDRDGAGPCGVCVGRVGVDRLPAKADDEVKP